jgi:hypothetical protein
MYRKDLKLDDLESYGSNYGPGRGDIIYLYNPYYILECKVINTRRRGDGWGDKWLEIEVYIGDFDPCTKIVYPKDCYRLKDKRVQEVPPSEIEKEVQATKNKYAPKPSRDSGSTMTNEEISKFNEDMQKIGSEGRNQWQWLYGLDQFNRKI